MELAKTILPDATKRIFKKRSILLYQGEVPRAAFVIQKGTVKVYSINAAGEEQLAAFHVGGEFFPVSWIFEKSSSTQYYYEAVTDCHVLTVPREILRPLIQNDPAALDYFVTNYVGMMMRITALEQSRAREKIMFTLYYLLFRYGREVKPGLYQVDLGMTHSTIASLVGLTRETTSSELNTLRRQKIVTYSAKAYLLNKQALEHALGEDSFNDVSI